MKDSILKNILVNFHFFFSTNVRKRINQDTSRILELENTLEKTNSKLLCYDILDYYNEHDSSKYTKELDYLRQTKDFCIFPYPPVTKQAHVNSGYDDNVKLPYVVHKNKKLYFPPDFTKDDVVNTYLNYIYTEKILGLNDNESAPHQYQSSSIHVEDGDVVFDIGAAEGLFALDQIDTASQVIIVECDPKWGKPLRKTFEPFGKKVTIIEKLISTNNSNNTLSLETLLSQFKNFSIFIKMDIEGFEIPVLTSAINALKRRANVKLSIASYHKYNDANDLKLLFENIEYYSEFSSGFMLFNLYDPLLPPYFRKGIIRATRKINPAI